MTCLAHLRSVGEPEFKISRFIGYTKGIVIEKDLTEVETYPKGKALFKNQIVLNNQSAGGVLVLLYKRHRYVIILTLHINSVNDSYLVTIFLQPIYKY